MSRSSMLGRALVCALLTSTSCSEDGGVTQRFAKLDAAPNLVVFDAVPITTVESSTIIVRNTGDLSARLRPPELQDPDGVFTVDLASIDVPPNGSSSLVIRFAPNEVRAHEAKLVLNAEDPNVDPLEIVIRGMGVSPCVVVEPAFVDFGSVRLGTEKVESVSIRNDCTETANVSVTPVDASSICGSGDATAFCAEALGRRTTETIALASGSTRVVPVAFAPSIAGLRERARFEVRFCEGAACTTDVRVEGVGVERALACAPATIDFGAVNPASCQTQPVACENIANVGVTVLGWRVAQTDAPFESSSSAPAFVPPGERLDIDVRFCPPAIAEYSGALEIETDERPSTITVGLAGSGGGPDIELSAMRIDFGAVSTLGPARRALLVTNVGYDALVVEEMVLEDPGGPFIVLDAPTAAIEPGEAAVVTIQVQATAEGIATGRLFVRSNDSDEPELIVELSARGRVLGPCSYEVAPTSLNFGVVERGRTLARAIEIRNVGTTECLITGARITSNDRDAYVRIDEASRSIAPGSAAAIAFGFTPNDVGSYRAEVEIGISSPTEPFVTVALIGAGVEGGLLVAPNTIDFATVGVGCAGRARTVTVYNTGTAPVTVDGVVLSSEARNFTIRNLPTFPLVLNSGEQFEFTVSFAADREAQYSGAVEIDTGSSMYIVALRGEAAPDAMHVDEFTQVPTPKADILFVIDNSCSMSEEQAAIASNFPSFIQFAVAQNLDYQIGVISTDTGDLGLLEPITGAPQHRIVTEDTVPTPDAIFSQNVTLGISGSGLERGLETARLALSAPAINGHNAGFVRPDALLSIIFVSDEEDQSIPTLSFYANFFRSVKGTASRGLFTASAIVSGSPVCAGAVSAGSRYIELARQTGGVVASICTADWRRALDDIATIAFGFKTQFVLSGQPTPSTIDVTVDGARIPATGAGGTVNWRYDSPTNSVVFTPFAAPEPGARIRVEYAVDCL